ncbi:MAG TPA: hypothetical protein VF174_13190 [Micromonosporaceae bacterium]
MSRIATLVATIFLGLLVVTGQTTAAMTSAWAATSDDSHWGSVPNGAGQETNDDSHWG